ncbi:MAG: YciI family protein [Proteobacteria bacterium]|nr:YciI family protein [Pseudomonadota bacterium]
MQYLALIYGAEGGPPPTKAEMQPWFDFGKKHGEVILAGEALLPTSTATSIRVRDGQELITDGPFAETQEALGGFYLLEARDLDHAIAIAKEIPAALYGTVEVRPIMALPQPE